MTARRQRDSEVEADISAAIQPNFADLQLINQFLTDRLANKERAMVETRIVTDPEFRRELELTEAIRNGMSELARGGEIAFHLAPASYLRHRPPIAVAASVVAGLLAVATFLLYERLDQTRQELDAATDSISAFAMVPATNTEILRFEQTRSANSVPDVVWRRSRAPTLLELRFDVGLEFAPSYKLVVEQLEPGPALTAIAAQQIATSADGLISITVHSSMLPASNYRIRLAPTTLSGLDQVSITYLMQVVD